MSKPVILKLEGGLGNQLFQLAAGYFLAAKLETDLLIDQYAIPLTTVHGETGSGFDPFVPLTLPNSKKVQLLPSLPTKLVIDMARRNSFVKRLFLKFRLYSSNPKKLELFLETNDATTDADFLKIHDSMKIHGNFQSWKIVEEAARLGFPRIFELRHLPFWIVALKETVNFPKSLVLHFRVGDDTRSNYNFTQPDIKYYLEALRMANSLKEFTNIYVLSDDILRVREMFGDQLGEGIHFLEMPNDSLPAERLYVLSLFGGIICANSTFCGWAAWSIYNSGGVVFVPVPYSNSLVLGSRDFPSNWHQLDKYSGAIVA